MTRNLKLGYVGVGLMGGPMVKRLCGLGWRVRAYDIAATRCDEARAAGAEVAASAADAARGVPAPPCGGAPVSSGPSVIAPPRTCSKSWRQANVAFP